ncbi:MAG: hypothetical protein ACK4YP_09940 [Myxococcota bacterium]
MTRGGVLVAAVLTACSPEPGAAAGRLVDARTDAPVPDAEVRLVPSNDACPTVPVKTDAEGRWSASGLCGEAAWTVTPGDTGWYLPEPVPAGPDALLRVYRAPPDPGVYTIAGVTVTPLVTHTVLDTVRILDGTDEVRFPVEIPGALPRIHGDAALLLVGDVLPDLAFAPLVPSPERRWFGTKAAPRAVDPWVYLGVHFSSDTAWERVPAPLDTTKLTTVGGPRPLRYVPGDALPPGRYALPTADGARAFLVDFGAADPGPPPSTAP